MDYPIKMQGLGSSHEITERDFHDCQLPDRIGVKWKDLARALGYSQASINTIKEDKSNCTKECCIELLCQWLGREGRDATVGKLAEALKRIELKKLADNLIGDEVESTQGPSQRKNEEVRELKKSNNPNHVNKCENLISEMSDQLARLKEEVSKTIAKTEELEKELLSARQENSKLRHKIKELEDAMEQEKEILDASVSPDTGETSGVSMGTDEAAREQRIIKKLEELNQRLNTYVTSPLQVPEVNQDKLKTPVRLDLLTRLSHNLQELYSETQLMVAETCKCSEDLKRDFYDFAFLGLRAEHYDLLHRVTDLESVQGEMSEEEKKDFKWLQGYQENRQRQVERLEKLWKGLFSPLDGIPKTPVSAPFPSNKPNDKKKFLRRTDPGARPKQTKPRDKPVPSSEAPSAYEDGKYNGNFNPKKPLVKSIFRGKENEENRTDRRDS